MKTIEMINSYAMAKLHDKWSPTQIARGVEADLGLTVGVTTVARWKRQAGFATLNRRQRGNERVLSHADRIDLNLMTRFNQLVAHMEVTQ